MSSAEYWTHLLGKSSLSVTAQVTVAFPLKMLSGVSGAVLCQCTDDQQWVVKSRHNGRALAADRIVGQLGKALGAPVAHTAIVDVPEDLIDEEMQSENVLPGPGHGSLFIKGCVDSREILYSTDDENEDRFAALAVLYGLTAANDIQFLYQTIAPRLVHSVDHGHFFPGETLWSINTLGTAPQAKVDGRITVPANCGRDSILRAIGGLVKLDDSALARTIGSVPAEWDISLDEKAGIARFLAKRRDTLLEAEPSWFMEGKQ